MIYTPKLAHDCKKSCAVDNQLIWHSWRMAVRLVGHVQLQFKYSSVHYLESTASKLHH